jgi:hypothetical protein
MSTAWVIISRNVLNQRRAFWGSVFSENSALALLFIFKIDVQIKSVFLEGDKIVPHDFVHNNEAERCVFEKQRRHSD